MQTRDRWADGSCDCSFIIRYRQHAHAAGVSAADQAYNNNVCVRILSTMFFCWTLHCRRASLLVDFNFVRISLKV